MDANKDQTWNVEKASPEQIDAALREVLSAVQSSEPQAAVVMANLKDNRNLLLIAGQHHDVEEMIAKCVRNSEATQPERMERLDHYLFVGLMIAGGPQE